MFVYNADELEFEKMHEMNLEYTRGYFYIYFVLLGKSGVMFPAQNDERRQSNVNTTPCLFFKLLRMR